MKTAREMYQDIGPPTADGRDAAAAEALGQLRQVKSGVQEMQATESLQRTVADLEKLICGDPENAATHHDLALVYQRLDRRKAVNDFKEAIRLEPQSSAFKKNYAAFLYGAKDFRKALDVYVDVMIREPKDIEALMAAGHICRVLQRQEDAEVFYQRALGVEPSNLEARRCLESLEDERSHPHAL